MKNIEKSQYLEFIENINISINKVSEAIGAITKILDSEENFRDVNLEIIMDLNDKLLKCDSSISMDFNELKVITEELDDFFLENKIESTKLELDELENKDSEEVLKNINNTIRKMDLIVK